MPTGYTSIIEKGISFKEFALNCARAFGACISMRDDSSDKPIPNEFKASTYHKEKIKETKTALNVLEKITPNKATDKAKIEYSKEIETTKSYIEKSNNLRRKYEDMLSQVKKWTPPTSGHNGLKRFMVEQIEGSIKFDCSTDYWIGELKGIKLLTGQQWIDKETKRLIKDLDYHTKEDIGERSRIDGRNDWVKKLRDSI